MTIPTLSSSKFNQGVNEAKRTANKRPVFMTDQGRSAHVLLSVEDGQHLTQQRRNIADALAMPGTANLEFAPLRVTLGSRTADFS